MTGGNLFGKNKRCKFRQLACAGEMDAAGDVRRNRGRGRGMAEPEGKFR